MLILTNELHFQNDPKSRDAFRSGFAAFICEGIERQVIFAFFFFSYKNNLILVNKRSRKSRSKDAGPKLRQQIT